MKLQIVSDLHLEFGPITLENAGADLLVLAGDIVEGEKIEEYKSFFKDVSKKFPKVIYIPGNHEYYGGDFYATNERIHKFILNNYNNIIYTRCGNVLNDKISMGTMWSSFDGANKISMANAQRNMNDFHIIHTNNYTKKFTPMDALHEFNLFVNFIESNPIPIPPMIVTHHAPSFKSISPSYATSNINGSFASNLEYLMINGNIKLWVHGHMHTSQDYMIGNTRIVCNPRGYYRRDENPNFNPNLIVEVDCTP